MMATELILATLAVIVGLIYSLIRSRKNRNRMLSAAARRQKHAPKESLAPRRLNSKGKAVQHASDGQSSTTESRIEGASKGTPDEDLAEDASNGEHESQHESSNGATELTDSSRQIDQLSDDELVLGIDRSRESLVRPVAVDGDNGGEFNLIADEQYSSRQNKIGYFGSLEEGRVVLDNRALIGTLVRGA